jgi:peptide/nickel transport system substrate-binding protein
LKRTQPSFIALLATGWSPVYPCHIPSARMRTKPIGTGPFRFVEYRLNESMKLERNPDYWKKGLPYLDAIEYRIVPNRATRMLGFIAGKFDMSYPTDVSPALLKDIRSQAPQAQCVMRRTNVSTNLIINRDVPPFNNPDIRHALGLALDRQAFADIIGEGQPARIWVRWPGRAVP